MTAWMSWSTGKDSTYALHVAREVLGLDVVAGSLSPALVERYLELKERALL